jgi:hypothetical protein
MMIIAMKYVGLGRALVLTDIGHAQREQFLLIMNVDMYGIRINV